MTRSTDAMSNRASYLSQGFLILKGVLDPDRDLTPLKNAYSELVDDLVKYALGNNYTTTESEYRTLDFPQRFASLVGLTHGSVFDHLDPSLNVYSRSYRRWKNAPSAQPAALFELIRHPRILDALEELIGSEIWATPTYHINIKLASSHLKQAQRAERLACKPGLLHASGLYRSTFLDDLQMHSTPWHMDEYPGLDSESEHDYINVWVPLTENEPGLAELLVLPGSHLNGYHKFPAERENEAIALNTQPGDIVIMAGKLFHSSKKNQTADSYRWAINMRYTPVGHRCGRRILPGFVARSRKHPETQLQDAKLWSKYWDAALDYLDCYLYPVKHVFDLSVKQVDEHERHWKKILPDSDSWLDLHRHGTRAMALRTLILRGAERLRGYLSVLGPK